MSECSKCGEKLVCKKCEGRGTVKSRPCSFCGGSIKFVAGWEVDRKNGTGGGGHCRECERDKALHKKFLESREFVLKAESCAANLNMGGSLYLKNWRDITQLRDLRKAVEGKR